jgi:hypothetical protein
MLTTLAFLAALPLAPAQAGDLSLTNPRLTYGLLGPVRSEPQILPGDNLTLRFEIENLTVDPEGKAKYTIALEAVDAAGKPVFQQPPRPQEMFLTLGGNSLPGSASLFLAANQAPGEYTLKVLVKDAISGKSAALAQKFTVLPKALGLVGLSATCDPEGTFPVGLPLTGESLYLNVGVIGFTRGSDRQPNVVAEIRILDEQGKPTLPRPFSAAADKDVPDKVLVVPFQFLVSLNRPGKFTAELKATDKLANKTVTMTIPFTVAPPR